MEFKSCLPLLDKSREKKGLSWEAEKKKKIKRNSWESEEQVQNIFTYSDTAG